jgi:hypothetical protein
MDAVYLIRINPTTVVSVKEENLLRPKWVEYFGSVEAVQEFIKNNKPVKHGHSIYTKP